MTWEIQNENWKRNWEQYLFLKKVKDVIYDYKNKCEKSETEAE